MRKYGLIGFPLTHSFSKKYFSEKFERENIRNCSYELFSLNDIGEFPSLLKNNPDVCGLNVTIPYKISVMKFLSGLDATAKAAGAVNTIKIIPHPDNYRDTLRIPQLIGYNTDVHGFENTLLPLLKPHHTHALVLGTGGASRAVEYVLKKLGIGYRLVTRNTPPAPLLTYLELDKEIISSHTIIVNTTPLGMSPDINSYPAIPYEYLSPRHLLYDLVYNPGETLFLKKGKEKGAMVQNGIDMLIAQAEKAWEIWNTKDG